MGVEPKYRRLTLDELKDLEQEFVDFLIINGIAADDWVRIKVENPDKADDVLTLFSDVVLEGAMRKIRFLEFRTARDIKAFQCLPEKIILMGMRASDHSDVDFTDDGFFARAARKPPGEVQVYTLEKRYNQVRELEVFDMIRNGCQISGGQTFKTISLALADSQL